MKKINICFLTLSLICTVLIVGSCTKLKDTSYTDIVAADFVPTSDDVAALVGTSYGSWRYVMWAGSRVYWTIQEESTDAFVKACKANQSFCEDIHTFMNHHTWNTEDAAYSDTWIGCYDGVNNCNRVLFQIETDQIPLDPDAKIKLVSEIKVLRASYYFVLCDLWGNVPILTTFDVPAGFLPEQSTRLEVYNFIVSEILAALPDLVDAKDQTTYGRFNNKGAAYALLAKTYLNAEVWSGTARWTDCIAACDAVISAGKYSLEPVQANCFKVQNENSVENIFAIPFGGVKDAYYGYMHRLHLYTLPFEAGQTYNMIQGGWGGLVAIPQFISSFDPIDKRVTDAWLQGPLKTSGGDQIYVGRGDSIGKPFILTNTLPSITHSEDGDGLRVIKYEVEMGENPSNMGNDVPLFRYADILMMKAESLMRLGQPGSGELVTQVRMRNFSDPAKATVTDEQLLGPSTYDYGKRDTYPGSPYYETTHETTPIQYGRFLDELGWEFCAEAHRRTDMIRFGIYNTRSWLSHQASNDNHTNLGPIPLSVLNTNPNLTQNPGY
jgi:starch-binding outer membrane protein, SusD/RagB family